MGRIIIQLLSLTELYLHVLSVPYAYQLVHEPKNWNDAQAYCRENYIDLATIENNVDMTKLQNRAQKQQFSSSAWIGLYNDINSWRWSLDNESLGTFTNWGLDEPTFKYEGCCAINQWSWFDAPCFISFNFVCYDARNTGSSIYVPVYTSLAYAEAQSYCRQHHTDLASAKNQMENSAIQSVITSNSWFGLYRDVWTWSDHTNVNSINWVAGQPWAAGVSDNCGYFSNGMVDVTQCPLTMPFFCERDFTKKKTIRITLNSTEDVNSPSVKDAIMQKIIQKVQEHQTAEKITVKWIEKPGGIANMKNDHCGIKASEQCDSYFFSSVEK